MRQQQRLIQFASLHGSLSLTARWPDPVGASAPNTGHRAHVFRASGAQRSRKTFWTVIASSACVCFVKPLRVGARRLVTPECFWELPCRKGSFVVLGGLAEYVAKMLVGASGGGVQKSRQQRPRRRPERREAPPAAKSTERAARGTPRGAQSAPGAAGRAPGGPQEAPRRPPGGAQEGPWEAKGRPGAAKSPQASIFDPSEARALVKTEGS